jgi:hypothetical protein
MAERISTAVGEVFDHLTILSVATASAQQVWTGPIGDSATGYLLQADVDNTASIFVGGSTVTSALGPQLATNGVRLLAGSALSVSAKTLSTLYAKATAAGQILHILKN